MELQFEDKNHKYSSINDPDKKWTSVTTLIGLFEEPFIKEEIAKKCSKNKKSKWYGIEPEKIIEYWDKESERANTLGTWYHNQREQELISCETLRKEGLDLPIFAPIIDGDKKISPNQILVPGIYPEHFMYLKSVGICGQSDRVEVIGNRVDISDYKTYKKIETRSYVNWEGKAKMMLPPLDNVEDCKLMHGALQLSIYMYIILKHNPQLVPGKLTIQHVTFEVEREDEFSFPVTKIDSDGNYVIKEVVNYEVPYLKQEVQNLIKYIQLNPQMLNR